MLKNSNFNEDTQVVIDQKALGPQQNSLSDDASILSFILQENEKDLKCCLSELLRSIWLLTFVRPLRLLIMISTFTYFYNPFNLLTLIGYSLIFSQRIKLYQISHKIASYKKFHCLIPEPDRKRTQAAYTFFSKFFLESEFESFKGKTRYPNEQLSSISNDEIIINIKKFTVTKDRERSNVLESIYTNMSVN
ncbi:MAG: hypothetical protein LH615_11245, partial [Ferruginibacter sp.]|nr:hypothetical protein [Ferruginibacter sp.]